MLLVLAKLETEVAFMKCLRCHWYRPREPVLDKCAHTDYLPPSKIYAYHFQRCALDPIRSPGQPKEKQLSDENSVQSLPVYGVVQWVQSSHAGRQSIVLPCQDPLRRMDHLAITILVRCARMQDYARVQSADVAHRRHALLIHQSVYRFHLGKIANPSPKLLYVRHSRCVLPVQDRFPQKQCSQKCFQKINTDLEAGNQFGRRVRLLGSAR